MEALESLYLDNENLEYLKLNNDQKEAQNLLKHRISEQKSKMLKI